VISSEGMFADKLNDYCFIGFPKYIMNEHFRRVALMRVSALFRSERYSNQRMLSEHEGI